MRSPPRGVVLLVGLSFLNAQCAAGLFTNVPLPPVLSSEVRGVNQSVPSLTLRQVEEILVRNYYVILFEELGGVAGETPESFADRMLSQSPMSAPYFAIVTPQQVRALIQQGSTNAAATLSQEVAVAQAPLARRLARVSSAVTAAAGRSDLRFELDPAIGMNAGAAAGFDSRRIVVGPQVIMLARSEDSLAFVLGHEVAHITQGHTRTLAIQNILVGTVKVAAALAVIALYVAAARDAAQDGYALPIQPEPVAQTAALAATFSGVVATGAIQASGFPRDQEREADYYGLRYASGAGYDPARSADMLIAALGVEKGQESRIEIPLFASHPATAERVVRLRKWGTELAGPRLDLADRDTAGSRIEIAGASAVGRGGPNRQKNFESLESVGPGAGLPSPFTEGAASPFCWLTRGADRQECNTCCSASACRTECVDRDEEAPVQSRTRPPVCWNADSRSKQGSGVCTTCCTADVSCKTVCTGVGS